MWLKRRYIELQSFCDPPFQLATLVDTRGDENGVAKR
jgi:hypothetical protein